MNRKLKHKWIEALRSNEYKQGSGNLHSITLSDGGQRTDTFCCLGVLCDMSDIGKWRGAGDNRLYYFSPELGIRSGTGFLGDFVQLFGLDEAVSVAQVNQDVDLKLDDEEHADLRYVLIRLNDALEWSFSQIADFIERYVPETDEPLPVCTVQADRGR